MENRKASEEGWVRRQEQNDVSPELYTAGIPSVSQCRVCRFFAPTGRRGGECLRLAVPVAGMWPACALAEPVFASAVAGPDRPWALSPELGAQRGLEKPETVCATECLRAD